MTEMTREQFDTMCTEAVSLRKNDRFSVSVCAGTGCISNGSMDVYQALKEECERRDIPISVCLKSEDPGSHFHLKKSGCQGFCEIGPMVTIEPTHVTYTHVQVADCVEIVETTILNQKIIERLLYVSPEGERCTSAGEIPFFRGQKRVVLGDGAESDPEDLTEYLGHGGYRALEKALFEMNEEEICQEILDSGLRGRGGGGYPTGKKWSSVLQNQAEQKYIVCNGDEGDPGAFMDQGVMEGNPHSILEGMMIAGVAVGADTGYLYVRAEYPLAVKRLEMAIHQLEEIGLLGDHILGTSFNFRLFVNRGAGAFVCGEGSALMESIEGKRGMPRTKPPRTAEKGLWGKPTVLNNVETFANVPKIILNGVKWYRSFGTENSPGTKTFALTGNVVNTGLVEVPMGTTLREVIFNIGGGIRNGKKFKTVQIGGPSGGCLTEEHLDYPLDFDSLKSAGAMIGSGGMVVMDEDTCLVEVARFFMEFTQRESCGKCVPCREGTKRMLEILNRIVRNEGTADDLNLLEELSDTISHTALCGLGRTACQPVISTLKYFRSEYLAHTVDHYCPICNRKKPVPVVDMDKCMGCTKCANTCPVGAINGQPKQVPEIDPDICISCGACAEACPVSAISFCQEG